jgi:predicted anti-sigma-YlaC factor YlaD
MNISCELIKDLLPLYLDGVCSNNSKTAVEEHLAVCDTCRTELQNMQSNLPIGGTGRNLKEAEAVKNLSKRWKKGMMKSLIKGALIALAVIAIIAIIIFIFADVRIVPAYGGY